jgi:hypothetical protein
MYICDRYLFCRCFYHCSIGIGDCSNRTVFYCFYHVRVISFCQRRKVKVGTTLAGSIHETCGCTKVFFFIYYKFEDITGVIILH